MKTPRFLASIFMAVAFVFLSTTVLHPRFEENDDPTMLMQVSGYGFSGNAHSHWVFASPLVGWSLKTLYQLDQRWPWYALYLCALLSIVTFLLFEIVYWSRAPLFVRAVGGMVGLYFVMSLILRLQFTALALGIGFLLTVLFLTRSSRAPPNTRTCLGWGVLVGITALIRTFAPIYLMAFSAPILLIPSPVMQWRSKLIFSMGLLMTWALCMAGQTLYYGSLDGWGEYLTYNSARSALHDSVALRTHLQDEEVLKTVGWSPNDRDMFNHWFFTDPSVFSINKLKFVANLKPFLLLRSSRDWFVACSDVLNRFYYEILMIFLLVMLVCTYQRGYHIALGAFFVLFALGGCAVYLKAPPRIVLPVLLMMSCSFSSQWLCPQGTTIGTCVAITPQIIWRVGARQGLRWILSASILWILLLAVRETFEVSRINSVVHQRFISLLTELRDKYPATIYIWFFGGIELKDLPPFADLTKLPPLELLSPGWDVFSPDWNRRLLRLGLFPFETKLSQRNDVVVLAPPQVLEMFRRFMIEHHGVRIETESLAAPANIPSATIQAYRFKAGG